MKKIRANKKEVRIGLDIGTGFIKIVELSREGDARRISKIQHAEVASPPTEENIGATLKSLLDKLQPSVKDVNIAFSSPHAIVRFINMPKMKEEELKNSLRFEAEKYIPFNVNEVVTDASILGYTREDKRDMRVLFAAVKRKALESRLETLRKLGLSVSAVDIDSFACFNAFCNSTGNADESKSIALLNAGHTYTNLIILQGTDPFFSRDIQIGGKDMEKAVPEKTALSALIEELRLSFGYYENQHGRSIGGIYLSGGASRLEGISKYFEENFGMKTMPWDPFSKFETDQGIDSKLLEAARPGFAVAAGLAMR